MAALLMQNSLQVTVHPVAMKHAQKQKTLSSGKTRGIIQHLVFLSLSQHDTI